MGRITIALLVVALCVVGSVADDALKEPARPKQTVGSRANQPEMAWKEQPRHGQGGPNGGGDGGGAGAGGEGGGTASSAARHVAKLGSHSDDFLLWARRFNKLQDYCGSAPLPCEESLHREGIWRENQRLINKHNSKTEGGSFMKKGLTRFADLSVEEFISHHATYNAPLLKNEPEGTAKGLVNPDLTQLPRESKSAKIAGGDAANFLNLVLGRGGGGGEGGGATTTSPLSSSTSSVVDAAGGVSLKTATDAAAAAGELLPSEGGVGGEGMVAGIFGRVFPSLGASGAKPSEAERQRRAHKRRAMKQRLKAGLDLGGPLGTGLPKHHSWGDTFDFGEIIHQGTCAGCWAYSTAAVVEAAQFISSGRNLRLSPYSLIDCDNLDHGCMTGNMASAYSWIQTSRHGIPQLQHYPERGASGCDRTSLGKAPGIRTEGYCDLPVLSRDSERQMLEALWQQPVAVGVNIHALQFYESGIVKKEDCPPADSNPLKAINHAAVLTGWGYDEPTRQYYWILRNTYGDHWGEQGYARLAFGQDDNNFGTCALYTEGNFPLVGNLTCTPSSVRKEAVKHGKHVWLYPGGYNMGPHDAAGLRFEGAAVMLGESTQSALLVVACGLVAASTVVMAAQAMALSRIKRDNDRDRVDAIAISISGNRGGGDGDGGGGGVGGGGGGGCDPEKGERDFLRVGLLGGDGAGGGAAGGRYGTSCSPLDSDAAW